MTEKKQCCVRVYGAGSTFRGHMCTKAANVENDGRWYCGTHDPERVAKKKAESQAKFDAQAAIRRKQWRLQEAAPDMLAELKRLFEIHGYQSTADVIAKAEKS